MKPESKKYLRNDILDFLEPTINECIETYSKDIFYQVLSAEDLVFIYENTYPGYQNIQLIKDTEQYCYMSLFGDPITIPEFEAIRKVNLDPEEDYIDSFEIYFENIIDKDILHLKEELLLDDALYLHEIKNLVISRKLKELNSTLH